MILPTFLGIGVQRAGTTWLHQLLAGHPEIYMPVRRKEVRFFDKYYEYGAEWYASFFPPPEEAGRYTAIGEISTQYYDCNACPERIYNTLPESKLIIMLRHPVSRAYSHYGFCVQRRHYRGSFEQFLKERPKSLQKGYYSQYLKKYLRYFDRKQILVLISEDVFVDAEKAKLTIANFLQIDAGRFALPAGSKKVNASSLPAHPVLYRTAVTIGRKLRKVHLEPLVDLVMRLGVQRTLSHGRTLPGLDEELKAQLSRLYVNDFDELERRMQIDVSVWRK